MPSLLQKALLAALLLPTGALAKPSHPVIGYLPCWRAGVSLSDIPFADLTHVSEAFALPQPNGSMPVFLAPGPRPGLVAAAHAAGTKVLLSIGGQCAPCAADWASSVLSGTVDTFVANLASLVTAGGYDGIDIDWEYPNKSNSAPAQKAQYTTLMVKLASALKNPADPLYAGPAYDGSPKQITFFTSPGYDVCGMDFSDPAFQNAVDYGILSGYRFDAGPLPRYNGPISKTASDVSNWTFGNCKGWPKALTVNSLFTTLTGGGPQGFTFPAAKLLLGLPFFEANNQKIKDVTTGTKVSFNLPYGESLWTYGGNSYFVTDAESFAYKTSWALAQGMSGIALWDLTQAIPRNLTPELCRIWDTIGEETTCGLATPTPSPAPPAASLKVESVLPSPNPQSGPGLSLRVKLNGPADRVELRVYSSAFTLVAQSATPTQPGPWWPASIPLPQGLPAGVYAVKAQAWRNGAAAPGTASTTLVYLGR